MSNERLPGLQIARASAAISVMYFHSWTALDRFPTGTAYPIPLLSSYGGYGVDLFFAISGFVICLVVARPEFEAIPFLLKRIFRVYPLWLVTLSLFASLTLLWRKPLETETLGYFVYSATLLLTKEFPYYGIGWSLQHEIFFYVVAATIVPFAGVYGLAAFLAMSTAIHYSFDGPWFVSSLSLYHAEFLSGMLAFFARDWLRKTGVWLPLIFGTAGFLVSARAAASGWFPPCLFLMLVGFANIQPGKSRLFATVVLLGDASYSIYLLHPLVFSVARSMTAWLSKDVLLLEEPIRFFCMAATLVLSIATWWHFETPMNSLGSLIARKFKARTSPTASPETVRAD